MAKKKEENTEKKKGSKLIIIIAAVVIIALGAGAGVYMYLSQNAEPEEVVIVEAYADLGEIFVNLSSESEKRYVKLTATMTYDSANADLLTEIESKMVELKDTAVFYFKSLTDKDFNTENEGKLKQDLITKLNENLESGDLLDIKFPQLLIQ